MIASVSSRIPLRSKGPCFVCWVCALYFGKYLASCLRIKHMLSTAFWSAGCKNCANMCPKTFELEDDYGRARAVRQGVFSHLAALDH